MVIQNFITLNSFVCFPELDIIRLSRASVLGLVSKYFALNQGVGYIKFVLLLLSLLLLLIFFSLYLNFKLLNKFSGMNPGGDFPGGGIS